MTALAARRRIVAGAGLVTVAASLACQRPGPRKVAAPPPPPRLQLTPLADLVAAGGLRWMAELKPRVLFENPALLDALAGTTSEAELDAMARAWGGVDLRSADELVAAGYDGATLLLVHQVVDPPRLEAAFTARVADVEGRAVDRSAEDPRDGVVRLWGSIGTEHEALVVFGHEAAGLSLGSDPPLRAAELFAEHKMKRAKPVWSTAPLDAMARLLGDAPVRLAAAGPFRAEWATGVGGLLGEATAAGVALRAEGDTVWLTVVLAGPWGDRATEATKRLDATYAALAASGVGRLMGLGRPVSAPATTSSAESVTLEVRLGLRALVRGLGDATASEVAEIMRR